jgi:4-diphosphocytidyl-2-C-methyl-D-erythritol kinase
MTWNSSERSYAKINFFLKLLFKREDNYHEISSLFCKIDFFDELTLEASHQDELIADLIVPEPFKSKLEPFFCGEQKEENLLLRTVKKLRSLFNEKKPGLFPEGLRIQITKRVPSPAGLGGGSGNAAIIFRKSFELLSEFEIDKQEELKREIYSLAINTGADIPFFLQNSSGVATGLGEKLEPILIEKHSGYLIVPPILCSTSSMFAQMKKPLQAEINYQIYTRKASKDASHLVNFINKYPGDMIENHASSNNELPNDFRALVIEQNLPLQAFWTRLSELSASGWLANMTGSGSAFFCLHRNNESCPELENLREEYSHWQWLKIKTI